MEPDAAHIALATAVLGMASAIAGMGAAWWKLGRATVAEGVKTNERLDKIDKEITEIRRFNGKLAERLPVTVIGEETLRGTRRPDH